MIPIEIIKNHLGINVLPSFCTYLVTWRCNCRCKMCTIWKKHEGKELKVEEVINIFKQRRFDVVRITGGEPFLRDDLSQIVNGIQKYGKPKILHITSNGILTDRILNFFKELKKTGNLHLKISIDAVGKKHDEIRGIKDAYQSALNSVRELLKIRQRSHFYLGVNQTIVDENGLTDYWRLKETFSKLYVPVHPALAYGKVALYSEKENLNLMPKSNNEFLCFSELPKGKKFFEMLNSFGENIDSISSFKERLIQKYYLRGLYNRLKYKKGIPNPPCLSLKSHLRILPNGDVPICLANSTIVGNLKKTSLKDLWSSNEVKKFRKLVKECPGCWYGCEIIPNSIYSGDIIKELFY